MEASIGRGDFFLCYYAVTSTHPSPSNRYVMHALGKSALVLLSGVMLFSSFERLSTRLRIWASVCLINAFLHSLLNHYSRVRIYDHPSAAADDNDRRMASHRIMKRLEAMSEILSAVLWFIAVYWNASGGLSVLYSSPSLPWIAAAYLAFEIPSAMFCFAMTIMAFLVVFGCCPIPATAGASEGLPNNSSATLAKDSVSISEESSKQPPLP